MSDDLDTDAVSAIVSTMLALAMTVIIGGGVYVVVAGFGAPEPSTVAGLARDDLRNQVVFVRVAEGSLLSDFRIHMAFPGDFDVGHMPTDGDLALPDGEFVSLGGADGGPADGPLFNGMGIYVCVEDGPIDDVTVTITHVLPKTMIWETTFLDLPNCA